MRTLLCSSPRAWHSTGRHHTGALIAQIHGHRWIKRNALHKSVLCTKEKPPPAPITYHRHKLIRVRVPGVINSPNLLKACQAKGLVPVCGGSWGERGRGREDVGKEGKRGGGEGGGRENRRERKRSPDRATHTETSFNGNDLCDPPHPRGPDHGGYDDGKCLRLSAGWHFR